MKGFIFSIEMILTIIILLSTLIIIGTNTNQYTNQNNNFLTNIQSNQTNSIYYQATHTNIDKNNLFCNKIILYNVTTQTFKKNIICEGFE
ncbi:MAG: hypothetical protein PHX27_00455 [Candidatus ainarchaeum sp.]|nr:hypothetical protein [Candidatus ainarchaeum sp.]